MGFYQHSSRFQCKSTSVGTKPFGKLCFTAQSKSNAILCSAQYGASAAPQTANTWAKKREARFTQAAHPRGVPLLAHHSQLYPVYRILPI